MIKAIKREKSSLVVETKTTGFSSPAVDYAERRLDVGDLVAPDPLSVFYFRIGPDISSEEFFTGDILAVNRWEFPEKNELCVGVNGEGEFTVYKFGTEEIDHWGKITWIIRKVNG